MNGESALILRANNQVGIVLFISINQGRVGQIWVSSNPDKLKEVNRLMNDVEEITD